MQTQREVYAKMTSSLQAWLIQKGGNKHLLGNIKSSILAMFNLGGLIDMNKEVSEGKNV